MNRRFRLNRFVRTGFWGCVVLLLVCLTARLLWRAAGTETGIQTLQSQWRDATLGWFLGSREPISSREPTDQAKYWLREVDRVLEAHPNDAELTMGAAVVLDSPGEGFAARYLKGLIKNTSIPDLNQAGIKRAEDAFEKQCGHRCLELAARATKTEPTNIEWWRLHALLLHGLSLRSSDGPPRDADWLNTLNQCAQHDPDNALYDYLAADYYWEAAAEIDFSGAKERLVIKDADKFNKGIARFEQGQTKRCFSVGDRGFTAVADFLSHSQIPLADQPPIVNGRRIHLRRQAILRNLWRWQCCRANQQELAGNINEALALHRQNLHLIAQHERDGTSTTYDLIAMASKMATATQISTLADTHKGTIGDSERKQIAAVLEATRTQQQIIQRAMQNLAKSKSPPTAVAGTLSGEDLAAAPLFRHRAFSCYPASLDRPSGNNPVPAIGR